MSGACTVMVKRQRLYKEFVDLISGRDSDTNYRLISKNEYAVAKIIGIKEDCMYYDVKCISLVLCSYTIYLSSEARKEAL
jgi:hypothetical protein